jgi:hypothetical protein
MCGLPLISHQCCSCHDRVHQPHTKAVQCPHHITTPVHADTAQGGNMLSNAVSRQAWRQHASAAIGCGVSEARNTAAFSHTQQLMLLWHHDQHTMS